MAGDPRIVGEGSIPTLLKAIGGALAGGGADMENEEEAEELVEGNTKVKLGQALQRMQASCPPQTMAAAWQQLPPLQQRAIQLATQ